MVRRITACAVGVLMALCVPMGIAAQGGAVQAQIQAALRAFPRSANTWTGTQTFQNVTVNGTCTGCGGGGGISFADLATPPTNTALGSSGAPFSDVTASGVVTIGPPESDLDPNIQGWTGAINLWTSKSSILANKVTLGIEAQNLTGGMVAITTVALGGDNAEGGDFEGYVTNIGGTAFGSFFGAGVFRNVKAASVIEVEVASPSYIGGGSSTDVIGVHINEQAGGDNNYAIKSDATAPSLFGGSITATDFIVSGSRFKSDTTNAHTGGLAVYDVDGAAYKDFLVWTNANAPAVVLSTPAGGTFSGDFSTLTIASATVATQTYVNAHSLLQGTTGSIGGGLLAAVGSCATGTATVIGAVVGKPVFFSTSDGTAANSLVSVYASVTATNTVTLQECALAAVTPTAKTWNVAVAQ